MQKAKQSVRLRTKTSRQFAILEFCIPHFRCRTLALCVCVREFFPYRKAFVLGCCHISEVNNAFAIGKFITTTTIHRHHHHHQHHCHGYHEHTQACVKAIVFSFFVDSLWIYSIHTSCRLQTLRETASHGNGLCQTEQDEYPN